MPRRASSLRSRVSRFVFLVLLLTLACAGAAKANSFSTGQFVTYDQGAWSNVSTSATILSNDFASVYAPSNVVGVGSGAGFTMGFVGPSSILTYLPAGGPPGTLTSSVLDPTTTSAGSFGGDVLALQLNVDFSNAGFLAHPSNTLFGGLVLQNFTTLSALNGLTVNQFLADANTCLGGGSCLYSISIMDTIANELNGSFEAGVPTTITFNGINFSPQTNLALPGSVTPTPEPSSLLLLAFGLLGLGIFHFKPRRSANSVAG